MKVQAWSEVISLPTYGIGSPEKLPMFLEKRVYQGSSGVVYPHAVIETIDDTKTEKDYLAIFLENDFLKIMILPELGGRVHRAYDKARKRDFVYYNQVVKPALVGLTGPWISGGIEFNWPQHHRPSTFLPVDHTIAHNVDGSVTVWVHELELMFRTKGMAGFTLYPDKAYLEIKGRLFNRTPLPQTFLWWANPAVKVNEHYQSIFPPDVQAVFDHGRRDVTAFPIARGTYYKVDYSPGTDISGYKNIPVPTSYMAVDSNYNFIGCYEHQVQAGMLHVADHHISPGKKQWTWGNGEFGWAWDKNLTDEDGPYIELMTGVFTDNQPDFTWIAANENKSFEQYFMPFSDIGGIKNATKEAALYTVWKEDTLEINVYATANYPGAQIIVQLDTQVLFSRQTDLIACKAFFTKASIPPGVSETDLKVCVITERGSELVSYQAKSIATKDIPEAAKPAKRPADIEHIEQLYLSGHHLEQYRHATYNPVDYYQEGLNRDPYDIRCNNAMGLWLLRRGQFLKALPFFKTAIATLTSRNPNPYDGEVFYNLGLCSFMLNDIEQAYDAFYKATWNDAWQHSAFLFLAKIALCKNEHAQALQHIEKSIARNYHSSSARHIKAIILRETHADITERSAFIEESLTIDPFNYGCLFERYLLTEKAEHLNAFNTIMRSCENNYLELTLDYTSASQYTKAMLLLAFYTGKTTAIISYYKAWLNYKLGNKRAYVAAPAEQDSAIYFPNKLEEIEILKYAIIQNTDDPLPPYLLGNLWYDKRQYAEAIECWELAASRPNPEAAVFRNLALAYYNKQNERDKALLYLEEAFRRAPGEPRILMELDQLYKIKGEGHVFRINLLNQHQNLVDQRDDLYLEQVTLLNNLGHYQQGRERLLAHQFHPWEGGEGKVIHQYIYSTLALARKEIGINHFQAALSFLQDATIYPESLGEGKLYGTRENDIHFLMGYCYKNMGNNKNARDYYERATLGSSDPVQAIYYNDPQPDKIVYQGLAWRALGEHAKADSVFSKLLDFGIAHLHDSITIDYFAVSLPDLLVFDIDLDKRNKVHCVYLQGLGKLGLGHIQAGIEDLEHVLTLDVNHQGAKSFLQMHAFFESPADAVILD